MLVLTVLLLLIFLIWSITCYIQDVSAANKLKSADKRLTIRLEVRKTLSQFVVGYALIAGLVVTWINVTDTQKQFEFNSRIANEELSLAWKARASERYFTSSKMLGDKNETVRISGILELKHIALEDPKNYRHIVIDVLSAFVKSKINSHTTNKTEPASDDILNCIYTLGELKNVKDKAIPVLTHIRLKNSNLSAKDLSYFDFGQSNMENVNFRNCILISTDFTNTILDGADYFNANLKDAILKDSSLKGAKLSVATLTNADFSGANLENVNFLATILSGTILRGANLKNAQYLTQPQIEEAIGDKSTILPDFLNRPSNWR